MRSKSLRLIALLALAGVVANVVVALPCLLIARAWTGVASTPTREQAKAALVRIYPYQKHVGCEERQSRLLQAIGAWEASLYATVQSTEAGRPIPLDVVRIMEIRAGWPLPSFEWRRVGSGIPLDRWVDEVAMAAASGRGSVHPSRALPSDEADTPLLSTSPIWRGVIFNSLFYAAMFAILVFVPLALRRFIRNRRGLCAACGYPVGANDRCTECGRAIPARKTGEKCADREDAIMDGHG